MTRSMKVRSLEDLAFVADRTRHILTLFSGGVDSSYLLHVLSRAHCKVTALVIDLDEGSDYAELERITNLFGAELRIVDGRSAFVEEAVLPAIHANAQYLGIYPISSSLSRPIIAKLAVEAAAMLGCDAIVHTANQSQNSLRRLNGALKQLGFQGYCGSPYEYSAFSREEKIEALCAAGLTGFQSRGTSGDANLWVREYESGSLDNPEDFVLSEDIYKWTSMDQLRPYEKLAIRFERGRPVALNDQLLPMIDLIAKLNHYAGSYQVGRFSGLEHLEGGEKVFEVREAPAAMLLMQGYRHLETATLDAELIREKMSLEQIWVREAIEGRWFGGLRAAAGSFIEETARQVTGTVTFRLRAGCADLACVKAEAPAYLTDRDAWEKSIAHERGTRNLRDQHVDLTLCQARSA